MMDQDKDGIVDPVGLRSLVKGTVAGAKLTEQEAAQMFSMFDADGDEQIDFEEFRHAVCSETFAKTNKPVFRA